ncbi:ATP-binding protein [Azospirillum argentinense]|uniref:ATP-binding protein n=1 Tax=Azospirillum argentinense TaxID=2970906 RepID=A0A2K1FUB5_9PROT|nr:ATP-binding protein [Azospirillum argentinense]PNQ96127.1 ATP-binding protein [Azospirillum argentinense]
MRFLILRILTHSELGMFHEYRRQGKEGSKQRAVNFDWDVVDRVFPAAKDTDRVEMDLLYDTDQGVGRARQWLKRQEKNWRLEGNCPKDKFYHFVDPGCLFAMEIDAGTAPGSGAWAVFPADHPVTRAVLADGESCRLAKSAMIALHDEEGERVWRLLGEARPDLFTVKHRESTMTMAAARNGGNGVALPPNPSRTVSILASVGYSLPDAVADLVDNAISADATEVSITFGRPDGGHGRWMGIADNGVGMDRATLEEAMRIGSASDYDQRSLGKYGYGLKGASWSQAKILTVVSKSEGAPACHLTWDVNDMDGWVAKSDPLERWEEEATALGGHGTVVLWKDMRPPQTMPNMRGLDPYSSEIMQLERHLALVFHRFLEGRAVGRKTVAILINGKRVEPNNPFGHPLASAYDAKTIRIPTCGEDGRVLVQAYLLPSEGEISSHHAPEGQDAVRRALDLIGLHGKRTETQGLFIYRHDRLIKWGGWHEMWNTTDEKTKLARVVVDFDHVLDDAFKINVSKRIVLLPQQLQEEIKKVADVARRDSQRKYRKGAAPAPAGAAGSAPGGLAPTVTGAGAVDAAPTPTAPMPTTPAPTNPAPAALSAGTAPASPATSATPALPPSRIAVKPVKTEKFFWKVTKGMTGTLDVQVSDLNPSLSALVQQIRDDPLAVAHLAAFLGRLDEVDAQSRLMAGGDA